MSDAWKKYVIECDYCRDGVCIHEDNIFHSRCGLIEDQTVCGWFKPWDNPIPEAAC